MNLPIVEEKIPLGFASQMDYGNFGDLLSRYIVEKLSGMEVVKYSYNPVKPHFSCIGSILSRNEICSPVVVYGSGFISPQETYKIKLTMLRQYLRGRYGKAKFCAVRGIKSREILIRAGFSCPEVYGDPALLMPLLYKTVRKKKYRLGIICHGVHEKLLGFLKNQIDDVLMIPINRKYENITGFIDDVCECEVVLSSSLHGLIIANAYDVPVVRLIVKGHPIHPNKNGERRQNFKYEDYLSGFNSLTIEPEKPKYEFACLELSENTKLTLELVNSICNMASKPCFKWSVMPLLKAFPYQCVIK